MVVRAHPDSDRIVVRHITGGLGAPPSGLGVKVAEEASFSSRKPALNP
jgi:hypothetical protein